MAIRATSETIVAGAVSWALFVIGSEKPRGRERIGRRVDDPAELQDEHQSSGAQQAAEDTNQTRKAFRTLQNRGLAYAR
jgi:hypothetical protein